jgi:UPF0716 family protein affecting phage T7 exclusion
LLVIERFFLLFGSFGMIWPGLMTDFFALLVVVVIFFIQRRRANLSDHS